MKAAAAIFVRTPGLSRVKTRLAKQVGDDLASRAYELSLACYRDLADRMAAEGVDVVWAVAEPEGLDAPIWRGTGHDTMLSGEGGGLGECLDNVYHRLRERADRAILLGSDSPQLVMDDLRKAWTPINGDDLMAGPATDGGFYLFAGSSDIPAGVWTGVEYSASTTLGQLEGALDRPVMRLATLTDFDDLGSLVGVLDEMPEGMSQAQAEFAGHVSRSVRDAGQGPVAGSARNIS